MVRIMEKNKVWIYGTILICIGIIAVPSTYKVIKRHNERLLENTIKKIVEAAKDCYYNNSCIEDEITLEELYEKEGLPQMFNPVTKKIYNSKSFVSVSKDFSFEEVEE